MSPYLTSSGHDVDSSDRLRELFPNIDADPTTLPSTLDPFTITTSTGFMPLRAPRIDLPASFASVQALVGDMPVLKADGSPGLLATYDLGPTIDKGILPDLTEAIDGIVVDDGQHDLEAVTAVFRDYAFIASAYLLEPCWERFEKGLEGYGLGRDTLPACIAGPLLKTAELLDIPPFLSYAAAYCLYNYTTPVPSPGRSHSAEALDYPNLRLIRAFQNGLDPTSSEAGFVLTHVDMVKHSAGLVNGTVKILDAIGDERGGEKDRREEVKEGFEEMLETMQNIEASMETMWAHSKPKDYNTFRAFIFGITSQTMFPNGVVYSGANDNLPLSFRGESGANDAIIPLLDHLLQIPMPSNPLTTILHEFRSYRPRPHRAFLAFVRERAAEVGVKRFCVGEGGVEVTVLYLRLLDTVRSFRWRHWLFAREYILRRTSHPTATGGSPIVTWLPNQLFAVMELMTSVWEGISKEERARQPKFVREMMENVDEQREKLGREVEKWCRERGVSKSS